MLHVPILGLHGDLTIIPHKNPRSNQPTLAGFFHCLQQAFIALPTMVSAKYYVKKAQIVQQIRAVMQFKMEFISGLTPFSILGSPDLTCGFLLSLESSEL